MMWSEAIQAHPQDGKKMLFVLPPAHPHAKRVIPSHHPIMSATLAAEAIREGAHVGVMDAALLGLSVRDAVEKILEWEPDWVGFVPFEYRRELPLTTTLSIVEILRERGCRAHLGVVNASWGALEPRRAIEKKQLVVACRARLINNFGWAIENVG